MSQINTYSKMRRSNRKIRAFLVKKGFKNIYFCPHSRSIMKDIVIDGVKFDGIATANSHIAFFQAKTNRKPSKKTLENHAKLEDKYDVMCLFIACFDRKGVIMF